MGSEYGVIWKFWPVEWFASFFHISTSKRMGYIFYHQELLMHHKSEPDVKHLNPSSCDILLPEGGLVTGSHLKVLAPNLLLGNWIYFKISNGFRYDWISCAHYSAGFIRICFDSSFLIKWTFEFRSSEFYIEIALFDLWALASKQNLPGPNLKKIEITFPRGR